MSRGRTPDGNSRTSRRRFLRGVAGLSLGATILGALAACRGPAARPASKRLPRIGYFGIGTAASEQPSTAALREGLEALGYRESQTIRIEWRYADGDPARWPAIARELVDLHPDVIVVESFPPVPALLALTRTIPVVATMPLVFGAEQLIQDGYIKSQVRPGGNFTGQIGATPTLAGKRLDLLHETVPGATRLAVLRDASISDRYSPYPEWTSHVLSLGVSQPDDLNDVFARFQGEHAELLAVDSGGSRMFAYIDQVAEQARRYRLPAIGDGNGFAARGGLMSYTADGLALEKDVGRFVDKILKGASPADLPVELPTIFKLTINKTTADALGITIPPAVLAQATEVLQ